MVGEGVGVLEFGAVVEAVEGVEKLEPLGVVEVLCEDSARNTCKKRMQQTNWWIHTR